MADWSNLKSSINSVIKTNGEQEITGQVLQNVLNTIVSNLGENATFVDVATPTTNPGAPDGNVFYIAYTVGTYSNFNGIVLNANEVAILLWNGSWTKKIVGLATAESLSNLHTTLTNIVSKLKASTGYLICSTGENTAAKTIAQTNFELSTNCRLIVKMINHNMAASPTLNVNNTGAKPLYYNGMIAGVDNTWESGEVLDVYYDGTNYQASNIQGGVGIGGNQILEWTTDAATTRLQVMQRKRKKGMSITYVNDKNETVNEQYINKIFTDAEWKKDTNWVRYSMYKDARIREIRSGGFRLNFYMEVTADKIGKKLILPVKCIKGHKYAIYIETEYDTSNFWITMGGISAEQANLYPLNDCNGRNGYMWEFTTSSWNGEFKLNEGGTSPTGSCHVYMYDLTQDVTMALDKVGKLELKQLHFMYKPIFYCEKNLNVNDITGLSKTFSFLIQNLKQNYGELGLNGDQNSRTYYFTNYKSFSNEKKYIIQCFLDKNDSTANALTIEVQYANMPWESVGSNSPDDMIAINLTQLPGYIFEITPKSVEEKGELVGIRVSINLNRYQDDDNEREQAKQPFKFILSMFEVCDSLDDLLMKQPIINRIAQSLNISDSYDMELVETYKITTLNPADLYDRHPFNFGFNKDKDRLKMYIAKIKSNNGVPHGVTNVRAIYRYQNENGIYENISRGVSSVINAYIESGQYVFEAVQSIQNNMQDQSPNYIEVALSNTSWRTTSADITVEIYEIRVKSSIYDGLVNVTYPINKNLPVGLTRLDLTSESITVNKDHTLSGIPAENVDFKYTFDNGKVFTCKAEVDYQGAGSMAYKKKNLKMDLLDEEGEAVELRIGTWLPMDSFHFKANWIDSTHCRNIIAARVMEQIYLSKGERPWDAYNDYTEYDLLKRVETGAMGHVDGFPIEIYVNNEYIGLYTFNLNKHRSNFNMKKSNPNQILIQMGLGMTWNTLPVKWSSMEIRNPKSDRGNEEFTEGVEPAEGEVKTAIERFVTFCNGATLASPTYTKDDFKDYLNIPFWIDFILFCDFIGNWDGYINNTMICTWDGIHWSPLVYDLDLTFGTTSGGNTDNYSILYSPSGTQQMIITKIIQYYNDDLIKRYAELRASGIFSVGNIRKLVSDFMINIGEAGYEKEQEIWPDTPSNGGNSSYIWYDGKDRIISFIKGKILHMDLKYGLIQSRWY